MRKKLALLAIMWILSSLLTVGAYANSRTSLSDVVNQNTASASASAPASNAASPGISATIKQSGEIMGDLASASDMSGAMPEVDKATAGVKKVIGFIVRMLSYAITLLLTLRVVLDLSYIVIPFGRTILANGHTGNPQTGASQAPQGMGSPFGGGFGGGGFGGGFGGGGFGMNRFGSPFGGGMGGMGGMGGSTTAPQAMPGRIQWVSNAALNAVAAETTVGPDGKAGSPMKIYIKDMTVILVITPILLVLAVTGVLTQLGFLIGGLLANAIGGIGGSL